MMVRRTSPMVGVATAKKAKRLFVLGKLGFSTAGVNDEVLMCG